MSNTITFTAAFAFAAAVAQRISFVRQAFPEYKGTDDEALKFPRAKDNPNTEGRKLYAKLCSEGQEKHEATITVPSVASLNPEHLQDLIKKAGKDLTLAEIVANRRKGLPIEANYNYGINDLLDEAEEAEGSSGKLSEEELSVYAELCNKFYAVRNYAAVSPLSYTLAQVALTGGQKSFLEAIKYEAHMPKFMNAFAEWVVTNEADSIGIVERAIKKQTKTFQKAKDYFARITAKGEEEEIQA